MKIEGRACLLAVLAFAGVAAETGVASGAKPSPPVDRAAGRNRYGRCLELVKRDAAHASAEAAGWFVAGGGAAALHCQALALVELKNYREAAQKLEDAAASEPATATQIRGQLLDQAGNAWLLAGDAGKAESAFSSALALAPKDEDVLSDRARERGAARNWSGAFDDLTAVLAIDPDRADVYVLRASALHAEGHIAQARDDIAHALAIYPAYPEALVERGAMRLQSGDRAGARADWEQAAHEAPDSAAGETARARLAALAATSKGTKR